jgi:hypothetical protein
MAPAMARQEHRLRFANPPKAQGVRGIAPGGPNPLLAQIRQAGKIINARAADHPYNCFGHAHPAPSRAAWLPPVAPFRVAPSHLVLVTWFSRLLIGLGAR